MRGSGRSRAAARAQRHPGGCGRAEEGATGARGGGGGPRECGIPAQSPGPRCSWRRGAGGERERTERRAEGRAAGALVRAASLRPAVRARCGRAHAARALPADADARQGSRPSAPALGTRRGPDDAARESMGAEDGVAARETRERELDSEGGIRVYTGSVHPTQIIWGGT